MPYVKEPKTYHSIRKIPIPDILKQILIEYVKNTTSFHLFANSYGELMTESQFRKLWRGIHDKINIALGGVPGKRDRKTGRMVDGINAIQGLTPHTFRHNYATMLYYAGIDVKEAKRILGHSDIKTTLEIYTHLDKEKSGAANKLNKFIAI